MSRRANTLTSEILPITTVRTYDEFTGTAGTTIEGRTPDQVTFSANVWTRGGGTTTDIVLNGSGQLNNTAATSVIKYINSGVADCVIDVTLAAAGVAKSLAVNYVDASNHWIVSIDAASLRIISRIAAVNSTVATDATYTQTIGDRIRVRTSGDTIEVYHGDTLRLTYSTAARSFKTSTLHGVRSNSTSTLLYNYYRVYT